MLQKLREAQGDGAAMQLAAIYAQWGRPADAIKWLDKAVELQDPGLIEIKVDPLLDPLRNIGRFKEILAGLHFPA